MLDRERIGRRACQHFWVDNFASTRFHSCDTIPLVEKLFTIAFRGEAFPHYLSLPQRLAA
jgi:hypothetical protein